MTRTIFKYELITGFNSLYLPEQSKVIHVAEQGYHTLVMWVEQPVESFGPTVLHNFNVYGTGQPIYDDRAVHVSTALMTSGLVWHVYQVK